MRLKDKVAIITGGAAGIGGGIADRFAAEGSKVVIADIKADLSAERVATIRAAGGDALFVHCDVTDKANVAKMITKTVETYGQIDILVNNAAFVHQDGVVVHFLEYSDEAWDLSMKVNLYGLFYCSQAAARHMAKRGGGGCIINLSSGGASRAHRHMIGYDTTKGGIEAATRAMALDLAPLNIRVNAIVPGSTAVDNGTVVGGKPLDHGLTIPLARQGTPADNAGAAVFLASDDAAYITGSKIYVDGGMDAQLRTPSVDSRWDPTVLDRI